MLSRIIRLSPLVALLPFSSGCVILGAGPEGLRRTISQSQGIELKQQFAVGMDGLAVGVASLLTRVPIPVWGLTWLEVGVYEIQNGAFSPGSGLPLRDLDLPGWEPFVRVRGSDETTAVLVKQKGSAIRGMAVVTQDGSELVIVQMHGDMNRFLERLFRGTLPKHGWAGLGGMAFGGRGHPSTDDADAVTDPDADTEDLEVDSEDRQPPD